MVGYDNGLRSPTPTKRPSNPKPSASDENDQYYQQGGPRKPMMAKNYMSPTISAASKVSASRKTILGERNEASEPNSSNTHVEKSQLPGNDSLSQAMQLSPSVSETHVDDEQSALSDGLVASRPYDPITNYLSPRPKFLRYNPNRRRELILGLENSISERSYDLSFSTSGSFESENSGGEEIGAATTPSPLASPCLSGIRKQEDEDVEVSDEEVEKSGEKIGESDEESDEENEEPVEEKGWFLKGVVKSLLVMLIVVLFALHMSPGNQQTRSEVVEYGHSGVQNFTFEAGLLKNLESGGNLWDQIEERQMSLVEVMRGGLEMGVEEVNVVGSESGGEVIGQGEETQTDAMEDQQIVIDEGVKDEGQDDGENFEGVEHLDEPREMLETRAEETEATAVTEEEKKGGIDEVDEMVVFQVEDIEDISDQVVDDSEFQRAADEPYPKSPISDDVDPHNQVLDVSKSYEEEGEVAEEKIDEMVVEGQATMDNGGTEVVLDSEAEGNWSWREELINHMKSQTFYIAILGVSLFPVIVASLVLVFRLKQRNGVKKDSSLIGNPSAKPQVIEQKKINENVSSLPSKPYSEPVIAEKPNSVLPSRGEDSIEYVYSSFRRMSLSSKHSAGAASDEGFHSQAPSVQLLGEFVVGEVSSSLRTCGMKTKITENEESNYSVSSKKGSGSNVHSVSIQSQPSVSEFSSMASPSHGSYTPQKIMKQKEGGKDGEVTSTPLRRSSRLRSRSVTSP